MPNHVHLQLECIKTPPGRMMNYTHTKYAKYFNKKYDFSGHVFEDRYGSELITSIYYELEVNRYIHLNPVKANLGNAPKIIVGAVIELTLHTINIHSISLLRKSYPISQIQQLNNS